MSQCLHVNVTILYNYIKSLEIPKLWGAPSPATKGLSSGFVGSPGNTDETLPMGRLHQLSTRSTGHVLLWGARLIITNL